ncbi:MAG: glucose-6-phosphate isomerase, partial [Mycobacteriales bacterium]
MSSAAGFTVAVTGEALTAARDTVLEAARGDSVAGRLAGKDAGLWGPEARAEASVRLGWLDLPSSSRALLPRLAALRAEIAADGLDHIVLAGMGGSSLAPEVICRTAGAALTVIDTTDPGQIAAALSDRLTRTLVVVSSKSGGTVETLSH